MLKDFWTQISNTGMHDDLSFINKSRVKITNRVVVIMSVMTILYWFADFFFFSEARTPIQNQWFYIIIAGLTFLCLPVLILNRLGLYMAARYLIIGFTSVTFIFNSLAMGVPFRTELFFFSMASLVFVIFANRKIVILLFLVQLAGYLIVAENIVSLHPELGSVNTGLVLRIIFAFGFLFFLLHFMQKENNQYHEEIEIKSSQLSSDRDTMAKHNYTKDKIFTIISHDLRSPIAALRSVLKLLNDEHITPEEFKKYSVDLEKQVVSLGNSLDELLTWSKAQLHGINPAPDVIKVRSLISEIATVSKVNARNKKIIITTNIDSTLRAFCDPNMFQSIMTNLISNAIKFTPVGGAVSISAEKKDSHVQIQVEDTGVGIPAENISKILNPTVLFTTRGTSNEKGTGLGLSMCSEFVKKNNGTFNIISEDGKGSRFIISLPDENARLKATTQTDT